jgi:hypothetical protein
MSVEELSTSPRIPDIQPLDVTLVRQVSQVGRWDSVSWKLDHVRLADDRVFSEEPTVDGDTVTHHGIQLRLYRDQVDDYHYNLSSDTPRLFLICTPDPVDDTLSARLATLSQSEAVDYMETEEEVLSCPITGDVRDWIEAWMLLAPVLEPERKKRRHRAAKHD